MTTWGKTIGATLGSLVAGPGGGFIGSVTGSLLETALGGRLPGAVQDLIADLVVDFSQEKAEAYIETLGPNQARRINHDLQTALRDAFCEALYDIGGDCCFPKVWQRDPRQIPLHICYLKQPQPHRQLWDGEKLLASGLDVCHCLQYLKDKVDTGELLPLDPPASQELADVNTYLTSDTPEQLSAAFYARLVAPHLAAMRSVLLDAPGFEQHLRRYLLDRTLVHLSEHLKQRPEAWRAFNRLLLEGLRQEVAQLGTGQQAILARLDALPSLEVWSEQIADVMGTLGGLEKQLNVGFATVSREALAHHADQMAYLINIQSDVEEVVARVGEFSAELQALRAVVQQQSPLLTVNPFQAPPSVPHFVAREKLAAAFQALAAPPTSRTVWGLLGMAGSGKTAFAIHLAHTWRENFADGVLWGDVGTLTSEMILLSWAQAFGVQEQVAAAPELALKAAQVWQVLDNKQLFIVLDNVSESEQVQWLMPTGVNHVILLTSRNRKVLHNVGATLVETPPFTREESLSLLQRMLGDARVTSQIQAAERLIHFVNGLPLALNIIAGLLQEAELLTLNEYADALQDEQTRLVNLADWEDSTKNVAASFELSYQHLPPMIQQLFSALAVFDGPDFDADAVAAVLGHPLLQVKAGLGRLYTLSLLEKATESGEVVRYRLYTLLKLFAQQKLSLEREAQLRAQALHYFIHITQQTKPDAYTQLDQDWQNVIGALRWAYMQGDYAHFQQGVLALTQFDLGTVGFLDVRGHWQIAYRLLRQAIKTSSTDATLTAHLCLRLGAFAAKLGQVEQSADYLSHAQSALDALPVTAESSLLRAYGYEFSARLARQQSAEQALVWIDQALGLLKDFTSQAVVHYRGYCYITKSTILGRTGALEASESLAKRGLKLLPSTPTTASISALINLSSIASIRGAPQQSIRYAEAGVKLAGTLGDVKRLATLLMNLSVDHTTLEQYDVAVEYAQQALQAYKRLDDVDNIGSSHNNLAFIMLRVGRDALAKQHLQLALDLVQHYGLSELELFVQINWARYYLRQQHLAGAEAALARAETLSQSLDLFEMADVYYLQAEVARARGDLPSALVLADKAVAVAEHADYALGSGVAWRIKGHILQAMQQRAAAAAAYQQSLAYLASVDDYESALTQAAIRAHG